jgi:hypothetical protein
MATSIGYSPDRHSSTISHSTAQPIPASSPQWSKNRTKIDKIEKGRLEIRTSWEKATDEAAAHAKNYGILEQRNRLQLLDQRIPGHEKGSWITGDLLSSPAARVPFDV